MLGDIVKGIIDGIRNILKPIANIMGFTDQRVYAWEMSVVRMIEDDDIPEIDNYTAQILEGIRNNVSIADSIKHVMQVGPQSVVNRYITYGETDYYYGLPELGIKSPPVNYDGFKNIVRNTILPAKGYQESSTRFSRKSRVAVPSYYEWGLFQLQNYHGYITSMEIGGYDYIFHNIRVGAVDFETETSVFQARLVRYPSPGNPVYEYIDITDIRLSIYQTFYIYKDTVKESLGGYPVEYGPHFLFIYMFPYDYAGVSGEYPEMVESPEGTPGNEDLTRMFPIGVMRRNYTYNTDTTMVDQYPTSKILFKKFNLSLDDMVTSLQEDSEGNPNEDMEDVSDAFFICGLNIYSDTPEVIKYFYTYFYQLYHTMAQQSYEAYLGSTNQATSVHSVVITEDNYNVTIFFRYIRRHLVTGSIGSVGELERTFDIQPDTYPDPDPPTYEGDYALSIGTSEVGITYGNSSIIFKRQITPTTYEQLTVFGFRLLTYLEASDGTEKGLFTGLVSPTSTSTDDIKFRSQAFIPLSYAFLELYSIHNIERILYESLNVVFFASLYEDLAWYDTPHFRNTVKGALEIIGIAVLIYSMFTGGWPQVLWQAALAYILKEVLASNDLTNEQKFVLVIVYIMLTRKISGKGFISGGYLADDVLQAISCISEIIVIDSNIQMESLAEEAEKVQKTYEEYQQQLQDIEDGLEEPGEGVNPLFIMTTQPIQYELPKNYYERTLNVDTTKLCTDYTVNYCPSQLSLEYLLS